MLHQELAALNFHLSNMKIHLKLNCRARGKGASERGGHYEKTRAICLGIRPRTQHEQICMLFFLMPCKRLRMGITVHLFVCLTMPVSGCLSFGLHRNSFEYMKRLLTAAHSAQGIRESFSSTTTRFFLTSNK